MMNSLEQAEKDTCIWIMKQVYENYAMKDSTMICLYTSEETVKDNEDIIDNTKHHVSNDSQVRF